MAMLQYIEEEPETRERFVENAYRQDPNIKDLSDFKNALFRAFNTETGRRASKFFNDDEVKALFESEANKNRISQNVSPKEFKRIFTEVRRDEVEVQRELPKGEVIKSSQVRVVSTGKRASVKQYTRQGRIIRTHNRGISKRWTPAEVKFLSIRRVKKISPKKIVAEYNQHFKEDQRSSSSVRTRLYRI